MKRLYIASAEHYSGKTALCLGLGKRMQADGFKVNYLKPLSLHPWFSEEHASDEDASFACKILGLPANPADLAPVLITPDSLADRLQNGQEGQYLEKIRAACEKAALGHDVLLLEGGGSLREGYAFNLPTPKMPTLLNSQTLMIIRYHNDMRVVDDALSCRAHIGDSMIGVIINRIPAQAEAFIATKVVPYLERQGIPVYAMLPETRSLAALTVGELAEALGAELLTRYYRPQSTVENLVVGAMTAETALTRFRQHSHKAVITGGDRTDIQMAALETSTTCLILTGNLHPSPLVLKQAEEFGVAVLLVPRNTMEAIETIDRVYGKTRLAHPTKLLHFQKLLERQMDYQRLYNAIGLA